MWAAVGCHYCVNPAVLLQFITGRKGFITAFTDVGLLTSVFPFAVKAESTSPTTGLTTEVTAVGLFSSVDPAVLRQFSREIGRASCRERV